MTRHLRTLAALGAAALAAAVLPSGLTASAAAPTMGRGGPFHALRGFSPSGAHVRVHPDHYRAFSVDTAQVRADLAGAPQAGAGSATTFSVPTPDGGTERFAVQRTSVMQPRLAAAHPEISTWSGHAVDDPAMTIAMDVTPMGFHASVRPANGQGSWYVDPAYNRRGTTQHVAYYGGSLGREAQRFAEREMPDVQRAATSGADDRLSSGGGGSVTQKVYRLALITDPTYATYFGADNVTAEKVTLLERVNQIYNDDLAVKMVLVNDNDKLNLNTWDEATGPNGPCGAHACYTSRPNARGYVQGQIGYCDVGTLQRNMTVLGQLIGASNYDIGHIMLGVNGGGIAGLGVVGSVEKGMGCTGLPDPTGDFMAIDYVAHEMGHEFGGNHTFNGVQGACSGGNRNAGTSVEPGSGSSVMAYAGICKQDDLQPHTDPYFSQRTLDEVHRYTGARSSAMDPVEVQDVAFTGFDTDGDSFTLGYPGADQSFTIVRGSTGDTAYTAENLAAKIKTLTGQTVTVAGFGYDPYADIYTSAGTYPAPLTAPNAAGFQVMFAGDPDPYTRDSARADMDPLEVTPADPSVTAHVGETAKGGTPGNRGFEQDPTGNTAPVVHAPASRTIPARTPFTLTGTGSDADGEPLVYLWEQNDDARGHRGTALISSRKVYGPLFRVFGTAAKVSDAATLEYHSPGENHAKAIGATRTFPDMGQVLGNDTNARSGRCQSIPIDASTPVRRRALNCYSEFLPTSAYLGTPGRGKHAMHFRLTARDRHAGGGGVGWDALTLKVDPSAGPFLVTSHPRAGAVAGGSFERVRWAVNGTRPLAHRVQILLSTNGGHTWNTVLRGSTPNDGAARVHYPYGSAKHARIMVRARGNYFFDVNDHDFRIK